MAKKEAGPDQARSWAIAFAAFIINILLSGISRANGLFYVSLIRNFEVSRLEANLPFTLRNIVRNLAGPIVGVIGQRYGSRNVTIIGGFMASLGIALCFFAEDVFWIAIMWGGVHGLGVALGNTLFQVVVNQHFLKHRATASGFTFSGGCVGAFFFPAILEYMLKTLGLQGTFLLTGGIMLNVLPAAILMKEPSWLGDPSLEDVDDQATPAKNQQCEPTKSQTPKVWVISRNKKISPVSCQKEGSDRGSVNPNTGIDNPAFADSELEEKKIHYERSVSSDTVKTFVPPERSLSQGLVQLCCDPMFHMISLSLAVFILLFDPSITVLIDYMKDKGLSEKEGTYFIITISLADFFGRLCFGWITDGGYMSPAKFMILLHLVQGICFVLLPSCYMFELLMALLIVYGMASGAACIMYPVLAAKYMSSVQSLAIGCVSFISGLAAFSVPPLIGYFRDYIGSYDGMFYITGGLSIWAGIFWTLEPLLVKLSLKIERSRNEATCFA